MLLLKKLRNNGSLPREGTLRIEAGEQLLLDRVCSVGGWNYGNRQVYGHDLWPYVPTTALALLALQDRRDLPSVTRSLEQIQKDLVDGALALALALARVCLEVYGAAQTRGRGCGSRESGLGVTCGNLGVERELARLAARDLETPGQNVTRSGDGIVRALRPLSRSEDILILGRRCHSIPLHTRIDSRDGASSQPPLYSRRLRGAVVVLMTRVSSSYRRRLPWACSQPAVTRPTSATSCSEGFLSSVFRSRADACFSSRTWWNTRGDRD